MRLKSNRKVNLVLIWVKLINLHLIKEVGMIPYYLHKNFGFESKILSFKNEREYPFLNQYTNGLKLEFIKKSGFFSQFFNNKLSVLIYLIKNAKKIDVLELIHLVNSNVLYCIIYKFFNLNGFAFLKTDALEDIKFHNKIITNGYEQYEFYKGKGIIAKAKNLIRIKIAKKIKKIFLNRLNLMSIECKETFEQIKTYPTIKDKIIYLPSGFDTLQLNNISLEKTNFDDKENIILNVGRLGTEQKATEVLLEALTKIKDLKDWRVILIGSIEPEFKKEIKKFYENNQNLKEKVIFTGEIDDRRKLLTYYQKSKIFCLTSRYESFGLVLVEAGYFGNYILSTNIPPARDITLNGEYGKLFNIDDSDELAKNLEELINNDESIKNNCFKIQKHIKENFLWRNIVSNLFLEIKKRRN